MKFSAIKTLVRVSILVTFLVVSGFGFVNASDHIHEPDCPYMPGEHSLCLMNLLDHLSAWENTFSVAVPSIFTLLFIWLYNNAWPSVVVRKKLLYFRIKINRPFKPFNFYQKLFSSGVLHPKIP